MMECFVDYFIYIKEKIKLQHPSGLVYLLNFAKEIRTYPKIR